MTTTPRQQLGRRHPNAAAPPGSAALGAGSGSTIPGADWLSLTDLGRVYGISAVHTGKLLLAAGLRLPDGEPSPAALEAGLAQRQHSGRHHQALWHREGCAPHLERQGLMPQSRRTLVGLWADLLATMQLDTPPITTSLEEMADDMPGDLVQPVNQELRNRGLNFQVRGGLS